MHPLRRAVISLVALWSILAAVWAVTQATKPTPEKFVRFLEQNPLGTALGSEREKIVSHAARMLNGLDFEQRRSLRGTPALRSFANGMNQSEKAQFAEMTMPDSVRHLAAEFNRMTDLERRRAVKRLQREWGANAQQAPDLLTQDDAARLLAEGRERFWEEANAKVKADLAPLLTEIEASVPREP